MASALFDAPRARVADDLHRHDFYSWTRRQAELMRAGRLTELEIENLAEEVETLGRSEASALEPAYRLICMHQLKRLMLPERAASRSWTGTIVRERLHAARVLRDNPGLKPRREELFRSVYIDARKEAAPETGIALFAFPETPPFFFDQAADEGFWA